MGSWYTFRWLMCLWDGHRYERTVINVGNPEGDGCACVEFFYECIRCPRTFRSHQRVPVVMERFRNHPHLRREQ